MRRTLPPTRDLACLEAVVRNRSVTKAAEELNLTQSAVSRRISCLEDQLGERLFRRDKQRLVPTLAAEDYANELRKLLNGIEVATTRVLTHGREGGALTLACLPTFGSRWLVPRLNGFLTKFPHIDINLVSAIRPFDFGDEVAHAAIHFGTPRWAGATLRYLMAEQVIPVAAPSLLLNGTLKSADELRNMTLIQHGTRLDLWRDWLHFAGASGVHGGAGPKFEYYSLVIEAAVAGLGVALLPDFLVQREIEAGLLTVAFDKPMPCEEAYYFVHPKKNQQNPNVLCFGDWIAEECARVG
ncbi:LysR substrate-binding domain-containing protein [Microvirga pudoricolor]|uniref:LysR substrate-binding domain-containing protein n=1 Tax=Microvirga pudoricolor TaxID=2778729 RepID=UPI00194E5FC0|nr:LysR substrate-binding domain-containing protein [Microvirga pudoricolor]MBM6595080.1 LysR family transcriptional regulator [Microvirga pudoricolor]